MIRNYEFEMVPIPPLLGAPRWAPGDSNFSPQEDHKTESGKNVKIMVIDDEALIAETVVEILNHEGFEATSVSSGASAIELAKDLHPAIVLSDVVMPGLNGIETGIKIREIVPNCKIILFSGQAATVDLLERARQDGNNFEILAKPIKPHDLVNIIRSNLPVQ